MIVSAQAQAAGLLEGMIEKEGLPPSIIFSGPGGAGKELASVWLASRLNCVSPENCDERRCPSCSKSAKLEHPDIHLVYPIPYGSEDKSVSAIIDSRREDFFNYGEFSGKARSIGIGLVRRIGEWVSKMPYEGRSTVVILIEAHLATVEAQNAFLKLLEEPPGSAVFILVTDFPDKLLPTILSRCREIRFAHLEDGVVAKFLRSYRSLDSGEAERLASLAEGDLRRAVKLLDEGFVRIRGDAVNLVRLVTEGRAGDLLVESEVMARRYSREEVGELFGEIAVIFRAAMRLNAGCGAVGTGGELEDELGKGYLEGMGRRKIPEDLRKIRAATANLKRNADLELTMSQLFLDLTRKWY